jgi:hypothetical protein
MDPLDLFFDPSNTARQTRARFLFQDQCVALRCAESLVQTASTLRAVVVEWCSDYLAITADGGVELVSIKHREPGTVPWSVSELDKPIRDLYRYWREMGERCSCVFASNRAVQTRQREKFIETWPVTSGLAVDEVARFLRDLNLEAEPLPDRTVLPAVGVDTVRGALEKLDRDPRFAPQCWQALVDAVARVAVEEPPTAARRAARLASAVDADRQTLHLADLRALVLRMHDDLTEEPVRPVSVPRMSRRSPVRTGWTPGAELVLGDGRYLLLEPIERVEASDRSVTRVAAAARQLVPIARDVRLRGVQIERTTSAATRALTAVRDEAELLKQLAAIAGLPRLVDTARDQRGLTLVTAPAAGRSLAAQYGDPTAGPYSPMLLDALLRGMPQLAAALGALHDRGCSHRDLGPVALIVNGQGVVPRDLGLATQPTAVGEGPTGYRAPEQRRPLVTPVGPHTDVYQLGALVYHVSTGSLPGSVPIPATVLRPGLSAELGDVLDQALAPDWADRPTLRRFCAQLQRLAGHAVALGG